MVGFCNENGNVTYSEEVLAKIVGLSTMECYGVVGMVSTDEDRLQIELFIMVEYGTKISVISNNIIQKVRYSVENYTGLKVSSITVNVQAVRV